MSHWTLLALCAKDPNSHYWFSYNYKEVEYAKKVCSSCSVRKECLLNAWAVEHIFGVNGGYSEFDIMLETWKEAKKENDKNWTRSDKILQKLLRKAK